MPCMLLSSVMWHPSGDSSTFVTLADNYILVCDIEPSGRTAKVCASCESLVLTAEVQLTVLNS